MKTHTRRGLIIVPLLLFGLIIGCKKEEIVVGPGDLMDLNRLGAKFDAGLSPNVLEAGKPLLNQAASMGSVKAVKFLLERGADVKMRSLGGKTAIYEAAYTGNIEIATLLLDAGADPKVLDHFNETPLREAALAHKLRMVEFLISRGVDPKTKNKRGQAVAEQVKGRTTPEIMALLEAD